MGTLRWQAVNVPIQHGIDRFKGWQAQEDSNSAGFGVAGGHFRLDLEHLRLPSASRFVIGTVIHDE